MNQLDSIKEILVKNLNDIYQLDRSLLLPENANVQLWGNYDNDRLLKFLSGFFKNVALLKNNPDIIDYLPVGQAESLRDISNNLINSIQSLKNIPKHSITSQHHDVLNQINSLFSTISSYGIPSLLNDKNLTDKKDIQKGLEIINDLLSKESSIKNSLEQVENFLEEKKTLEELEIQSQAKIFQTLSSKYDSLIYYLPLILGIAIAFWSFFYGTEKYFIGLTFGEYSVYEYILLKFSFMVIPVTISLFFIGQYIHYRKIKEFYQDKHSSILVMKGLMQTFNEHRPQIIENALRKVFVEFSDNSDTKISENTLIKLAELAKKQ